MGYWWSVVKGATTENDRRLAAKTIALYFYFIIMNVKQGSRHLSDDVSICDSLKKKCCMLIQISQHCLGNGLMPIKQANRRQATGLTNTDPVHGNILPYLRYQASVCCGPITVLKLRAICPARDLWKLARSCKQLYLLCLQKPWNLTSAALLSGF